MAGGLDRDARIVFTKVNNNGRVVVKIDNCSTASGLDAVDIEGTDSKWFIGKDGSATFTSVNGAIGATTLDSAYDGGAAGLGRTITTDGGAVVFNALGNDALQLNQLSDDIGLKITKSAVGVSNVLEISNAGTGKDIEGTGASWSFTKDGILQLGVFTDGTRPSPGTAGRVIFNSTTGLLNIDNGTIWTKPDGAAT